MFASKANRKNKLGLFMFDSKIYSLLGFFHSSSYIESNHKKIDGLEYNLNFIDEHDFKSEYGYWTPISNLKQLRHFDLNPKDHIVLQGYNSCNFIFARHKEEIPFTELHLVTKDFRKALFDYVEANGIIKLVATSHRIIKTLRNFELGRDTNYNTYIDKEILIRAFDRVYYKNRIGMNTDKMDKSIYPKEYVKKEPIKTTIDYYSHKESVIKDNTKEASFYKGGFVTINYLDKEYNIPLLPLMAWSENWKEETFDFYLWTWIYDDRASVIETLILGSEMDKEYIKGIPKDLKELLLSTASKISEDDYDD